MWSLGTRSRAHRYLSYHVHGRLKATTWGAAWTVEQEIIILINWNGHVGTWHGMNWHCPYVSHARIMGTVVRSREIVLRGERTYQLSPSIGWVFFLWAVRSFFLWAVRSFRQMYGPTVAVCVGSLWPPNSYICKPNNDGAEVEIQRPRFIVLTAEEV